MPAPGQISESKFEGSKYKATTAMLLHYQDEPNSRQTLMQVVVRLNLLHCLWSGSRTDGVSCTALSWQGLQVTVTWGSHAQKAVVQSQYKFGIRYALDCFRLKFRKGSDLQKCRSKRASCTDCYSDSRDSSAQIHLKLGGVIDCLDCPRLVSDAAEMWPPNVGKQFPMSEMKFCMRGPLSNSEVFS